MDKELDSYASEELSSQQRLQVLELPIKEEGRMGGCIDLFSALWPDFSTGT